MKIIRGETKTIIKKIQRVQKKQCFLCRIPPGSETVYQSKDFIIILDDYPAVYGHILVAPRRHVTSLSAFTQRESKKLLLLTRRADRTLRRLFNPFRVAIASIGVGVQHFHFHVIPIPNEEMAWDFKFLKKNKIIKYSKKERVRLIQKLRRHLR